MIGEIAIGRRACPDHLVLSERRTAKLDAVSETCEATKTAPRVPWQEGSGVAVGDGRASAVSMNVGDGQGESGMSPGKDFRRSRTCPFGRGGQPSLAHPESGMGAMGKEG